MAANSSVRSLLLGLLLPALCIAMVVGERSAIAQVDRGSISGTVTETTGGALRGARVTVRNLGTGQETRVSTDDQGNYIARLLIGGIYTVKVEQNGFAPIAKEGVEVHVNQVTTENFVLHVGSV